jgi:hypothetical protein
MPDFLAQLPAGGLWLSGVVAGLVALGWLTKRAWRGYRKLNDFLRKADVILDIAEFELQHNHGGSIKDAVSKIAGIERDVAELKRGDKVLRDGAKVIAERAAEMRAVLDEHAVALNDHVQQAAAIHDEQAAAIAHLAEALPIVARSTPHPDDVTD